MTQPELFSHDPSKECSAAALEKVDAATWRQKVADYYQAKRRGLIADEVALALGTDILTIRPRVTELKKAGYLMPTGERRESYRGNTCGVMIWAVCWKK